MKILNIDNMLEAAEDSGMPNLDAAIQEIETAANRLAAHLADHLKIRCGPSVWERDFGGLCATFSPSTPDQPCPEVIDKGDEGGDWEYKPNC